MLSGKLNLSITPGIAAQSTTMSEHQIILATINARYSHSAFALRWLLANLGPLRETAALREFALRDDPAQIADCLLASHPRIIALSVYVWNAVQSAALAAHLKRIRPEITIIAGGPEAAYEYEDTPLFETADYLIRGEGELAFAALAEAILRGDPPAAKVIEAEPPDLSELTLPYDLYTDDDIRNRILYVESTRGCVFRCEFCMSSLTGGIREFPLPRLFESWQHLIARGARCFKFVDRTFNSGQTRAMLILDFFLENWREDMQLHFEIVPDRLSPSLLKRMRGFPPGGLHLEVGVQTFNPASQDAISRRQDLMETATNLRFLREETGALLHADLVAGLPHETWDSFADGFDRLLALNPHVIQVGILKLLKGAPLKRHMATRRMRFEPSPPYSVIETDTLSAEEIQRIKRFARYFDLYHNCGDFPRSLPLLWGIGPSPFGVFMAFSDYIWERTGRTHRITLQERANLLYAFLCDRLPARSEDAAASIEADYHRKPGRHERLDFSQD